MNRHIQYKISGRAQTSKRGLMPLLLGNRVQISHADHDPRRTASVFQYHVTRRGGNTTAACISLLHHKKAFYVVTNSFKNK